MFSHKELAGCYGLSSRSFTRNLRQNLVLMHELAVDPTQQMRYWSPKQLLTIAEHLGPPYLYTHLAASRAEAIQELLNTRLQAQEKQASL